MQTWLVAADCSFAQMAAQRAQSLHACFLDFKKCARVWRGSRLPRVTLAGAQGLRQTRFEASSQRARACLSWHTGALQVGLLRAHKLRAGAEYPKEFGVPFVTTTPIERILVPPSTTHPSPTRDKHHKCLHRFGKCLERFTALFGSMLSALEYVGAHCLRN